MDCRICKRPSGLFFENGRRFFKCPDCWFIFSPDHVSEIEEEAHYKKQWGEAEPDSWLSKAQVLLNVIMQYTKPESILDFGSGCGSLAKALNEMGVSTTPLEPMVHGYLKDQNYSRKFDAVIGVEVIEHLPDPWVELKELEKILAPGGVMVFSTLLTNSFIEHPQAPEHFKQWWYKDDPTHVGFYCNRALDKLSILGKYDIDVFADQLFAIRKTEISSS
ncbi:MAG: class I SAM-dependent methyltransferase [Candidatus Nitronauta litoralis]|uniref:Class I SAM-dependent methyltransferase n=1 Tax=Candidatus Nitronauta litoralis TaxID=2705533 RepID=A0A7T0G1N6_9BACT|nr:MAG: class I SAM-dependent methyltransferase [Candidatus Nitronauta litoralis]